MYNVIVNQINTTINYIPYITFTLFILLSSSYFPPHTFLLILFYLRDLLVQLHKIRDKQQTEGILREQWLCQTQ